METEQVSNGKTSAEDERRAGFGREIHRGGQRTLHPEAACSRSLSLSLAVLLYTAEEKPFPLPMLTGEL